jgi:hypothetical protein
MPGEGGASVNADLFAGRSARWRGFVEEREISPAIPGRIILAIMEFDSGFARIIQPLDSDRPG